MRQLVGLDADTPDEATWVVRLEKSSGAFELYVPSGD
jgi:hypothetical protein